jgi:hypothetical protein
MAMLRNCVTSFLIICLALLSQGGTFVDSTIANGANGFCRIPIISSNAVPQVPALAATSAARPTFCKSTEHKTLHAATPDIRGAFELTSVRVIARVDVGDRPEPHQMRVTCDRAPPALLCRIS